MAEAEGRDALELVEVSELRVGDRIALERDGRVLELEVWRVGAAGDAGRRYGAGGAVSARVRPGGYGVTLDRDTAAVYGFLGRLVPLEVGSRVLRSGFPGTVRGFDLGMVEVRLGSGEVIVPGLELRPDHSVAGAR